MHSNFEQLCKFIEKIKDSETLKLFYEKFEKELGVALRLN